MEHGSLDGIAAWDEWLRSMKWDWFVTLGYGPAARGASAESARRGALEWMDALRARTPKAYAVVAIEQGAHLGGWHAHMLVGGTGAHPQWRTTLSGAWHHGHAHVVRYDPAKDPKAARYGVTPYLRKEADVEIIGRLQKWRPRVSRHA